MFLSACFDCLFFTRPSPGEVFKSHLRTIIVLRAALKRRVHHEVGLITRIQSLNETIKIRNEMLLDKKDAKSAEQFARKQLQLALLLSNLLNLYDEAILLTAAAMKTLEVHSPVRHIYRVLICNVSNVTIRRSTASHAL